MRRGVKAALQEIGLTYSEVVDEAKHVDNIVDFSEGLSGKFGAFLRGGRFRVGITQKLLNLYLKYLWCLDRIPTPPHCPFDSNIIEMLPAACRAPFTKVDEVETYEAWVLEAKKKAGDISLAEWELSEFENTRV